MHSFKLGFYFINYFMNELKIPAKDFLGGIEKYANSKTTPFIYKTIIQDVSNWTESILKGQGRGIYHKEYSDVYLDIEEYVFVNISKNYQLFYGELELIINKIIGNKTFNANKDILNDIKKFQLLRMPSVNGENRTINLKYNIPEYMFHCTGSNPKKIKEKITQVSSIDCKNYNDNYIQFVKEKIIWARKSDKIKNDIDYDANELKKIKKKEIDLKNVETEKKPKLFDSLNKFDKFSAIDIKNNRRL